MKTWVPRLMLTSAVICLCVLIGEAVIKMGRRGIEARPGGHLEWVVDAIGERADLRYEGDLALGHEYWRGFYKARFGVAPHRLIHPHAKDATAHPLILLDFETEAAMRRRIAKLDLTLHESRGGVGLASVRGQAANE